MKKQTKIMTFIPMALGLFLSFCSNSADPIQAFGECNNSGLSDMQFARKRAELGYSSTQDELAYKKFTIVTLKSLSGDGAQEALFRAAPESYDGIEKTFADFVVDIYVYPVSLRDQSSQWTHFQLIKNEETGVLTRSYIVANPKGGYTIHPIKAEGPLVVEAQTAIEIGKGLVNYAESDLSCEQPMDAQATNKIEQFLRNNVFQFSKDWSTTNPA